MAERQKSGAIKPPSTRPEHSGLRIGSPFLPTPLLPTPTEEGIPTQASEATQPGTTESGAAPRTRGRIRRLLGR